MIRRMKKKCLIVRILRRLTKIINGLLGKQVECAPSELKAVKPTVIKKNKINIKSRYSKNSTIPIETKLPPHLANRKVLTQTQLRKAVPAAERIMPFGRHEGKLLINVPTKYVYKEAAKGTFKKYGNKWLKDSFATLGKLPRNGTSLRAKFGKYKNELLINIPQKYISWLKTHKKFKRPEYKEMWAEFKRMGMIK